MIRPSRLLTALVIPIALACQPRASQTTEAAASFTPPIVRFGSSVATLRSGLDGKCSTLKVRPISPPFRVLRAIVKTQQEQIDCDGFAFYGKPRWTEFVIADDALQMVWVLTEASDEATLLRVMTDAFGPPTHRNDKFIAFANARVALRTDRPEVLFYSALIADKVVGWFGTPSTF